MKKILLLTTLTWEGGAVDLIFTLLEALGPIIGGTICLLCVGLFPTLLVYLIGMRIKHGSPS